MTPKPSSSADPFGLHPATTWAMARLAATPKHRLGTGGRVVLLALAGLADQALSSPSGYSGTTALEVSRIAGLAPSTTRRTLLALVHAELAAATASGAAWRIPEEAFA